MARSSGNQVACVRSVAGPKGAANLLDAKDDRKHVGQGSNMTIWISQWRYTAAAIRAMTARPEDRSQAIAAMLAAGGHLIGWYVTLGRYDWLIVAEAR